MCVFFVMLGEISLNCGYTYTLLDLFGWVRGIDLHFLALSFSQWTHSTA